MDELRIVYWNAAGLRKRLHFLRLLLRQQNVDVALINESHLKPTDRANIPGYHILRLDVTTATSRRGLLIAVRRNIVQQPLPNLNTQSFQSLGIEVHHGSEALRIFAVYRPPTSKLITSEVRLMFNSTTSTIAAGDWNAKHPAWRCRSTCESGRKLFEDADRHGYAVEGPDEPTHYSPVGIHLPTTIDLVVHKGMEAKSVTLEALPDTFGSDHLPVLVTVPGRPTSIRNLPPRSLIHWPRFEALVHQRTPPRTEPLDDPHSVERLATGITSTIRDALQEATAPPHIRSLPITPRRIMELIAKKRKKRLEWQRTREPATKTQLNGLIERIRLELESAAADSWEKRIRDASEEQPSLTKLCRQIMKKAPPVRPLYHVDGTLRYDSQDRADILADYLERQFTPNASQRKEFHMRLEEDVLRQLRTPLAPLSQPPFFSPSSVKKAIVSLKPRKAPGGDGITNGALRHLPLRTIASLTRLFNAILRLGYFPQAWKEGMVVMLPKPGKDSRRPESYRPITLLSAISKLFEKLLHPLVQAHLHPRPEQFGFRSGHSTTLQIARVIHFAAAAANKKESATAVLLDVAKAFDKVWHPGLMHKVLRAGTPYHLTRILADFLRGRTFRVRVESSLSSSHPILAGVPQGSTLSPILYSIYTDDLPVHRDTTLALYADDIAFLAKSLNPKHAAVKIQRALDLLPDWLADWRLTLNVAKTQAITFGGHRTQPPPLVLLGEQVSWSKNVTYLGVVIDRRLSMTAQIKKARNAARVALNLLRPVLSSRLPLRTKLALYKTYVRPHLTYATPAWYALTSECQRQLLQTTQNVALRRVVQAPRYVRNATIRRDLRIENLEEHITRLAVRTFNRADVSDHPHIRDIAPWHTRPPDAPKRNLPRDILPHANS